MGYLGIFIMTLVEGTFIPIPSEITLIPAGYLITKGDLSLTYVLICSIVGTISGALINYFIAYRYGRRLLIRYGKYFLFTKSKLTQMEKFFHKHGPISAFIGRIMPGLKHFISFPAGLARMDIKLFCIYTSLGGGLWATLLVFIGIFIGNDEAEIKAHLQLINYGLLLVIALLVAVYIWRHKSRIAKDIKH